MDIEHKMKLFLLLLIASLCASHFCPPRHYWSKAHNECLECEQCHITLIPCTEKINSICANIHEKNHHFQKHRIQFFDDGNEDEFDKELDSKRFIHKDDLYLPHEKDHHKKNMKHSKSKNDEKNHHKLKKHFEFKDDIINEDINYDSNSYLDYDSYEKPKKHKKHFEFNKKNKKHDGFLLSEEFENKKHHFMGKGLKKDNRKLYNFKRINSDEEKLEEWLLLSKKQLKLRKDDLLKTLKEENGESGFDKKVVRLNSPVYTSEKIYLDDKQFKKMEKHPSRDDLNMLKELSKDGKEFESLMVQDTESYRPAKPTHRLYLGEPSTVSEIIGQVKDPQETIRDEMGNNLLFEKPQINVIPFVPSKETHGGDVVSQPFTAAETLVWDWQAVAVVSAVASCLVFFTVVAIYFVINAKQWKKINKNYNKEIEEMSTRIALMHPIMDSANSDSHTTSLYIENIAVHGKEDDEKHREQIK